MFAKNKSKTAAIERGTERSLLIGIDIGTSWLRLIAGTVDADGAVTVRFYREVKSSGMNAGSVSDLFALSDALTLLMQDVEPKLGHALDHCLLGIAGRHIESRNEHGTATVQNRIVSRVDRDHCIENARSVKLTEGNHIIHVIPQFYTCDNGSEIINPIGLSAMRVEVQVHIISCSRDQENNLRSAIQRVSSDVMIDRFVFTGIAAADAVLSLDDKNIGVCLIDYDAGTVNVAVYDRQRLIISFGLERGGNAITRAIALRYGLPLSLAEEIKCKYGAASSTLLSESDRKMSLQVSVGGADGQDEKVFISKADLADVIASGLQDVFNAVSDQIEHCSRDMGIVLNLGAGFVLTGGVAKTRSIEKLATLALSPNGYDLVKVKVGNPRGVTWCDDSPVGPDKAVSVGLLRFGRSDLDDRLQGEQGAQQEKGSSLWAKIKEWFHKEL